MLLYRNYKAQDGLSTLETVPHTMLHTVDGQMTGGGVLREWSPRAAESKKGDVHGGLHPSVFPDISGCLYRGQSRPRDAPALAPSCLKVQL